MRSLVAIVILIGVASFLYLMDKPEPANNVTIIQSNCHFDNGVCSLELSEHLKFRVQLMPVDLPAMEPVFLTLTKVSKDQQVSGSFRVWFEGRDMNMGQHFMLPSPHPLGNALSSSAVSGDSAESLFFKGMIPVCSVDENMVWRLIIEHTEADSKQQIHYEIL